MEGPRRTKIIVIGLVLTIMSIFLLTKNAAIVKEKKEERRERLIVSLAAEKIEKEAANTDRQTLEEVVTAIYRASKRKGIDYRIVLALAKVESNFRNDAISPKGARGLLQIKPSVAESIAKDLGIRLNSKKSLHEFEKNVLIGTHILSSLIEEFYDIHRALSAYNMGHKKLLEQSNSDFRTTFSKAVLREYKRYLEILPDP
jgi:soluble lytic murein transglycosylase